MRALGAIEAVFSGSGRSTGRGAGAGTLEKRLRSAAPACGAGSFAGCGLTEAVRACAEGAAASPRDDATSPPGASDPKGSGAGVWATSRVASIGFGCRPCCSKRALTVTLLAEPVGSGLLALVIFGEQPGWPELLGGAAVLAGIWAVATPSKLSAA